MGWDWPVTKEQRALLSAPKKAADGQSDKTTTPIPSVEQLAAWQQIFSQPIPGGPSTRGFDLYFGTDVPNWPPYCFIENDGLLGMPTEFLPQTWVGNNQASIQGPALKDWQLERILPALTDRAVQFITESAQSQQPFLLYMPLTTPHTPLAVNAQWKGKSQLNLFADLIVQGRSTPGAQQQNDVRVVRYPRPAAKKAE